MLAEGSFNIRRCWIGCVTLKLRSSVESPNCFTFKELEMGGIDPKSLSPAGPVTSDRRNQFFLFDS